MSLRVSVALVAILLVPAGLASAQGVPVTEGNTLSALAAPVLDVDQIDSGPVLLPLQSPVTRVAFGQPTPANPFTSIAHDLKRFFSRDTAVVFGIMGPAANVAYAWDLTGVEESQEHLRRSWFEPGNVGGSFLVQTGAAVGTWAIGKVAGSPKTTEVGGDLLRAQLVSQVIVQTVKFGTRRQRPDYSNNYSFPSGHTASAFASATVLERHFGKKAGVPAFAFATYVAMARMSVNKHHMSDVIMGAAVGIAAGRTVTMGIGGARFALGVAPTEGGAAVVFSKR